jgi:hypothetical protein
MMLLLKYAMRNKDKPKYLVQKFSAEKRGILWKLTFQEWYDWWLSTNHYHERGRKSDQYCMCRFNDIGPYSLSNIYCDTNHNNSKLNGDAKHFKKHSVSTKKHFRVINAGVNNPMFGRSNHKPQRRPVLIEGVQYPSVRNAAITLGMSSTALVRRIEKGWPNHEYV